MLVSDVICTVRPNLAANLAGLAAQTCCVPSPLSLPGANITGLIPGFNNTILTRLPNSMLLIAVESVLMGFAFLAMIIVRAKRKHS